MKDLNIKTPLCEIAQRFLVDKCPALNHTYTPFYHSILVGRRNEVKTMLEIGVGNYTLMSSIVGPEYKEGASLRMWREYFPNATIYGCDILTDVLFQEERIQTYQVDQSNAASLNALIEKIRKQDSYMDIILDDGSHQTHHQIVSFQVLWPFVRKGGLYIIEDIQSSSFQMFEDLTKKFFFQDAVCIYRHYGFGQGGDSFIVFMKV